MFKTKRGWLLVAAALAVSASAVARADDTGGDNGMNSLRTSMNTRGSTIGMATSGETAPTTSSTSSASSTTSATMNLTGSTSPPSAAGPVVASKPANIGEPLVVMPSQIANNEGVRIAPVNPRGQGPTLVGPSG